MTALCLSEIEQTVCELVIKNPAVKLKDIDTAMRFGDLGMDSLEVLSLVMDSEDQFAIRIDDTEVERFRRINDLVKHIESVLLSQQRPHNPTTNTTASAADPQLQEVHR